MYITELVVPNTVNTMPEKTMMAFADHGEVRGDMVTGTKAEAQQVLDDLERVGISYDDVVDVLEKEGVEKFEASWNELVVDVQQELEAAKRRLQHELARTSNSSARRTRRDPHVITVMRPNPLRESEIGGSRGLPARACW